MVRLAVRVMVAFMERCVRFSTPVRSNAQRGLPKSTPAASGGVMLDIRLPDTVDDAKIEAKFDKGVLKVTAAKKPEAVKAEGKIEIKKS